MLTIVTNNCVHASSEKHARVAPHRSNTNRQSSRWTRLLFLCFHSYQSLSCQAGESNDRHFVVATQDRDLMVKLRAVPGVPVLRIDGPVPRLEEPSFASRGQATKIEKRKKEVYDWEKSKLPELKAKEVAAAERAAQPQRKRKVKGVNPLSCLKKKGNSTKGKRKAPTALKPAESDEQRKQNAAAPEKWARDQRAKSQPALKVDHWILEREKTFGNTSVVSCRKHDPLGLHPTTLNPTPSQESDAIDTNMFRFQTTACQ